MQEKFENLQGKKFGNLTVVEFVKTEKQKKLIGNANAIVEKQKW